ncbi:hypothetical protein PR001_g16476 [Phytophthora rubi]|uniref:Uncharacterized protein n=1 Tax=Phytophthora rubi TaxID=129364 RepID=A0A6A3KUJ7_9STRA|nr:hypothetical protein PR001_g16476 [Phytophthora rubi]
MRGRNVFRAGGYGDVMLHVEAELHGERRVARHALDVQVVDGEIHRVDVVLDHGWDHGQEHDEQDHGQQDDHEAAMTTRPQINRTRCLRVMRHLRNLTSGRPFLSMGTPNSPSSFLFSAPDADTSSRSAVSSL